MNSKEDRRKGTNGERIYAAIDLKSFYASVECMERGLDPMTAYLVVADASKTEKTICLAVSPALKAFGLSGRCRLFEVTQLVRNVKARTGQELDVIVAPPQMQRYVDVSTRIYEKVYCKFLSHEDIHVYSIDEIFADLTNYLAMYHCTARELVVNMIRAVQRETGITATAGIGSNLYLAKVAMDILAKHMPADEYGVRIAELTERSYREQLWDYTPLTAFWRIGPGIARRLKKFGIETMGELARRSIREDEILYSEFGIDAELMIDHAWGVEPCTIADIHAYSPENHSISVGQVLPEPYSTEKARLIIREMADALTLEMVGNGQVCSGVEVTIGYDREAVDLGNFTGPVETDRYGRTLPKSTHGHLPLLDAGNMQYHTSSSRKILEATSAIFDSIATPGIRIRRLYLVFTHVIQKKDAKAPAHQLSFLNDTDLALNLEAEKEEKEARIQKTLLEIKDKFGKNAILRGMNYEEGATGRVRNMTIGGHGAGGQEGTDGKV